LPDKHLHIVCFDVPYPPDYGGVIDVFYRIKALHELGLKIHLHCFEYGRGKQAELINYCTEINYYERKPEWKGFSFRLPYIVNSRANKKVLQNLLKDDHPVLLEGIHCTFFIFSGQLKSKKVFVRVQNVEFEYYKELAKSEPSIFKKLYFKNESRLLKTYEKEIATRAAFLAINKRDAEKYQHLFEAVNVKYLPPFVPHATVSCKEGKGDYCLYHGNLSVIENEKAAAWLCENIFSQLDIPLIIAGKGPSKKLQEILKQKETVSLIPDPSKEKLDQLIYNAQINVLPSFNATGIKIKLLNALFTGRHCIVNNATIHGTGLDSLCEIAETADEFKTAIKQLFEQPYSTAEIIKREELLKKEFDNKKNAELLIQWIY
jgi:hypothetical protein